MKNFPAYFQSKVFDDWKEDQTFSLALLALIRADWMCNHPVTI